MSVTMATPRDCTICVCKGKLLTYVNNSVAELVGSEVRRMTLYLVELACK